MKAPELHLSEYLVALRSGEPARQLETLRALREEPDQALGNAILDIIALEETHPSVRQEALVLLCDAQAHSLIAALSEALNRHINSLYLPEMVSICWQNHLDFTPLLPQLISLVSHPDPRVQIEAVTAVEINLEMAETHVIQEGLQLLKTLCQTVENRETRALIRETITLLTSTLQQRANDEKANRDAQ